MKLFKHILIAIFLSTVISDTDGQVMSFDILGGKKKLEIPFTYEHNFILVKVRMFGLLPMNFIFDTGAEHTILFKRQYADILGVQYDRRIPIIGSDLTSQLYAMVARQVTIQVDGLPLSEKDILVLENDLFRLDEITGVQIDGILGGEFFKNNAFHVDYRKQKITVINKADFSPPQKYEMIDIHMKGNKPYTFADVNLADGSQVNLELLLDTGAGIPLLLHNNSNQNIGLPDNHITGKLGMGLGGLITGYIGRIQSLELGSIKFDQVLTNFQDIPDAIILDEVKFRNGIVGNQLLSRFNVWFDYVSEKVYFKPRKGYNKRFKMDKSGLVIFATGQNLNVYVVQDVIKNSPADLAGIKVGDVIRKVQGLPSRLFSLNGLTRKFQKKDGKNMRLIVVRNNKMMKFQFKLKELI